jgi:exosortase
MDYHLWNNEVASREVCFALLALASIGAFWRSLALLFTTAFYNPQYSHIVLILPLVLALLYSERAKVFRRVEYYFPAGLFLLLLAVAFAWLVRNPLPLSSNDTLSLWMSFFTVWLVLAFALCFGIEAFRVAAFPLLFLFLMIPIPDLVLDRIIWLLQTFSTDMTFLLLKAANVPVQRMGFVLSLPGIDIEVARECSGIRSSLILLIVTLILGHLFLQSGWRQVLLGVLVLPITIAKNGLRIFSLSTLAVYQDPAFLTGSLHRNGGILFFALALGVVILIVWRLNKLEKKSPKKLQHDPYFSDRRTL